MRTAMRLGLTAIAVVVATPPLYAATKHASAQAAVDDLLASDRAFAQAGASGMIEAFAAMFDAEVITPQPDGKFARGREAAIAAIKAMPGNADAKASWIPVRGGLSADGQQGFTFGYMTVSRADGTEVRVKYLAYWVKRPEGWRVAAYKRTGRPAGDVSTAPMAPSLPSQTIAPNRNAKLVTSHRASLMAAEQAFSDRAQQIGLAAAFTSTGRPDSMNMGSDPAFRIGAKAIGAGFDPGTTSPLKWNADDAIVASSGDLGVTFGVIHQTAKPEAPGFSFFTVWRRDGGKGEWRYIAE